MPTAATIGLPTRAVRRVERVESSEDGTDDGESGDDDGPGFGVGGTLASLGGVGYVLRWLGHSGNQDGKGE